MRDAASPPGFRGRALLIEDNAIIALNAEDILGAMGFHPVDAAASVAQALQLVRLNSYSAAVVDLMVSDGSAMPAALALAAKAVPMVITSGYSDIQLPPSLQKTPSIAKPYDDETLRAALIEAGQRLQPPRV